MKVLDPKLQSYINDLLNVAQPMLVAADTQGGGSELFSKVIKQFAQVAHHVYGALDVPNRKPELYHDSNAPRVLLDPMTVLNRSRDVPGASIDDLEFWEHGDMIKTLCDYLDLRFGGNNACAKGT
jgi:hypothetical protein